MSSSCCGRRPSTARDHARRFAGTIRPVVSMTDPPVHTRLRRLVAKLHAQRGRGLRPRVEQLVAGLLDDIAPGSTITSSAARLPLPALVIAELLGVPPADQHRFAAGPRTSWRSSAPAIGGPSVPGRAQHGGVPAYLQPLIGAAGERPDRTSSALVRPRAEASIRTSSSAPA